MSVPTPPAPAPFTATDRGRLVAALTELRDVCSRLPIAAPTTTPTAPAAPAASVPGQPGRPVITKA